MTASHDHVGSTGATVASASAASVGPAARLVRHAGHLAAAAALGGLVALGATYLVKPSFTARTTFFPPQQQQTAASMALSQLGALAGLAGPVKSPADQYVGLMQSATVSDRIVDRFDLMAIYGAKFRFEARKELADNVRIAIGKKDGLIAVEVDDHEPQRAADIANQYVTELRRMANTLALTEAQQRRAFFEGHLKTARDRLGETQKALQASGFNPGALKAEPKAAAENYARLSAEVTAAEVRLQTMRRSLANQAPEVQQQESLLAALRGQLMRAQASGHNTDGGDSDYVGKYRDFKYQEMLFDLFARQYELARVEESREGTLIQVVDEALVPEHKSKPKRAATALAAALASATCMGFWLLWRRPSARTGRHP